MAQKPVPIGLLLCEQIIVEEKTRNVTLVNCFSTRVLRRFPSPPFPFAVVAWLTDGVGEFSLKIVVDRLDTFEAIYERETKAQFENPLRQLRFVFWVKDCSFPKPGTYQVSILVNGQVIAQRLLILNLKEENQ